jgi:trigger factor
VIDWYYAEAGRLEGPTSMVLEDNVVEFVLGRANVVQKDVSFETLMGNNA